MDEIISNISLIGMAVGFFLSALLISQKSSSPGTRTLGGIMFLTAGATGMQTLVSRTAAIAVLPGFFMLPAMFYLGPLIYFYTKKVLFRTEFKPADYFLHGIASLVMLIVHGVIHIVYPDEMTMENLRARGGATRVMIPVLILLFESSILIYAAVSYRNLQRYAGQALEQYAHDVDAQILWLRLFLLAQIIGIGLHACIVFASLFTPMGLPLTIYDALLLTGFIFFVFYYLIKKPYIFNVQETPQGATPPVDSNAPAPVNEKYRKQGLDAAARQELLARLEEFMRDEQPYLDDDINLNEVAARLDVPAHHVSMVINAELGKNFFSYINKYRLEEVTSMLADPDLADENVLNIAFRAGFRSKAAFNRVFKEHTRLSPRAYRTRALQNA